MLKLPELPACPYHPDGQNYAGFAGCNLCWRRFYFTQEFQHVIDRINRIEMEYLRDAIRTRD